MANEIITFGCRLNIYESEVIRNAAELAGEDNLIIINTCSVTKEAEKQARQAIRKLKKNSPHKKIIVTGCAAQINPGSFSSMIEVDKVIGNEEKLHYENYFLDNQTEKVKVNDIMSVTDTASHLISNFEGKARAFLQIQNGCNHRCTFCIIPFGRGNSRSVPIGGIVEQVKHLMEAGYNEVVLTGVDITDYGLDLPGKPSLGQMIRRLLTMVPNLPRLRLSSIDVAEIDEELFNLITTEPRIMPHIHISLQAGDNMILKRMKRRHNREDVLKFCERVREKRDNIAFGADIIAGFPTETEEMFLNTLNLVKEAEICHLHVFPYSERSGTPAARMPQVEKSIRKERASRLRATGEIELGKFLQNNVGRISELLIESNGLGKTENFLPVIINTNIPQGQLVKAKIIGVKDAQLIGELV